MLVFPVPGDVAFGQGVGLSAGSTLGVEQLEVDKRVCNASDHVSRPISRTNYEPPRLAIEHAVGDQSAGVDG